MSDARREFAVAALACAAGAGLVLLAATRTWAVEVATRPAPLPALRTSITGGAWLPWVPALGLVALGGSVALLATRGWGRRSVGAALMLVGGALAVAGIAGLARADAGGPWPAVCLLGAAGVVFSGTLAALHGGRWPQMGARYEAAPRRPDLWDELDRGVDPTARG